MEIAVVSGQFNQAARGMRLIELIHRAIPYPLVLLSAQDRVITLSLAHKRASKAEAGQVAGRRLDNRSFCPRSYYEAGKRFSGQPFFIFPTVRKLI